MADQRLSWTDGQAKAQVLEFVRSVTEPGASFLPGPERVAAFDNDDAGREFAYGTGAEKALAKAKERGWTVVSMQTDFKVVFDL